MPAQYPDRPDMQEMAVLYGELLRDFNALKAGLQTSADIAEIATLRSANAALASERDAIKAEIAELKKASSPEFRLAAELAKHGIMQGGANPPTATGTVTLTLTEKALAAKKQAASAKQTSTPH